MALAKLMKIMSLDKLDKLDKAIQDRMLPLMVTAIQSVGKYTIRDKDDKTIVSSLEKLVQEPSFQKSLSMDKESAKIFIAALMKIKAEVAQQDVSTKTADNSNILFNKPKAPTEQTFSAMPKSGKKG